MQIRVDGGRSTSENWSFAQDIPSLDLPLATPEQQQSAAAFGVPLEEYLRTQIAEDRSCEEFGDRAATVGRLVNQWLERQYIPGKVNEVWFRTLAGKFRLNIEIFGKPIVCIIDEDVVTDLLETGSLKSQQQLDRLLEANLGFARQAKAS